MHIPQRITKHSLNNMYLRYPHLDATTPPLQQPLNMHTPTFALALAASALLLVNAQDPAASYPTVAPPMNGTIYGYTNASVPCNASCTTGCYWSTPTLATLPPVAPSVASNAPPAVPATPSSPSSPPIEPATGSASLQGVAAVLLSAGLLLHFL